MEQLLQTLYLVASLYTGLPIPDVDPKVSFQTQDEMTEFVYGKLYPEEDWDNLPLIGAYYNELEDEIVLKVTFDVDKIYDQSVFLHEIIHYMQDMAGAEYECRGVHEKVAYDAQIQFLADHDEESPFDKLFLFLLTICMQKEGF